MEKLLIWLVKASPQTDLSSYERIKKHLLFWTAWGAFISLSVISDAVWQYKILIGSSSVLQGALIYYTFTYSIIPNLSSIKTILKGVAGILFVYCGNWFLTYFFYKIAINNNYLLPKMYLYNYALTYISHGFFGLLMVKNIFFEILIAFQAISLPFLLKFSRMVIQYYENMLYVQKEKKDLEVSFLRSQLNPHFLLNSLNNIYSQVISKKEKAADSIIVLSNLLNYTLYDSSSERVPLQREVSFIRDYIDLEKLRYNKNLKVELTEEGVLDGYDIAPLILICFIENSFKHGVTIQKAHVSKIIINMKLQEGKLFFNIENQQKPVSFTKDSPNKSGGGLGLINTKKRLELLYPQKHELTIKQNEDKFIVKLTIQLENNTIV